MIPTSVLGVSTSGIAKSDGTVTLTFQAPPISSVYTGAVSVSGSPPGAQWTAYIMGMQWGTWVGPQSFGPLQAFAGMSLQIKGSGLPPGTAVAANWVGQVTDERNAQIISPANQGSPANEVMLLPQTQLSTSGVLDTPIVIPGNADVHAIGISINTIGTVQCVGLKFSIRGVASNYLYYEGRPLANFPFVGRASGPPYVPSFLIVPFSTVLDPSFVLGLAATGGTATLGIGLTGYTAAIPPFQPPTIPTSNAFGSAGPNVGTVILAADPYGRQYLISSVTVSLFSMANLGGGLAVNNAPPPWIAFGTCAAGASALIAQTFPQGLAVPTLSVVNGSNNAGAAVAAAVTYQMV